MIEKKQDDNNTHAFGQRLAFLGKHDLLKKKID